MYNNTSIFKWYDKMATCSRLIILFMYFSSVVLYSGAQTYVPPRYGFIGDEGKFLDQQSEVILQNLITATRTKTGCTIFIVTEPPGMCLYSEEDALIILDAYTKSQPGKSILLYFCEDEKGKTHFQYACGESLSPKLNEEFFHNLNQTVLVPYNSRFMLGNGMIISVKLIEDVLLNGTEVDFDELSESLKEAPMDAQQLSQTDGARFGKSDEEDLFLRGFVFCLFLTILGIAAVYAMRTRGMAAWFLFLFMLPFWLVFFTVAIGDYGWVMTVVYVGAFIGGRVLVANNNWWFTQRTVLRSSGAFVPPPTMLAETRRRVTRKRFEGRGAKGSWEEDYE